jgi:hypothetical protein
MTWTKLRRELYGNMDLFRVPNQGREVLSSGSLVFYWDTPDEYSKEEVERVKREWEQFSCTSMSYVRGPRNADSRELSAVTVSMAR